MANRYAIATGNWSDPTIWDGGTLPTASDDVWAGGYDVTLDIDITVNSLRNDNTNGMTALNGREFIVNASDRTINADLTYSGVTNSDTAYGILTELSLNQNDIILNGDIIEPDISYTGSTADAIVFNNVIESSLTINGDVYVSRNGACIPVSFSGSAGVSENALIVTGDIIIRHPAITNAIGTTINVSGPQTDFTFTGTLNTTTISGANGTNIFNIISTDSIITFDFGVSDLKGILNSTAGLVYCRGDDQTVTLTAASIIGTGGDYAVELGASSSSINSSYTVNADLKSEGGKALTVNSASVDATRSDFTLNGDVDRSTTSTTTDSVYTLFVGNANMVINGDLKAGGYSTHLSTNGNDNVRTINGTVFAESDGTTGVRCWVDSGTYSDTNRQIIDTVNLSNASTGEKILDFGYSSTTTNHTLIKNLNGSATYRDWITQPFVYDFNGTYTVPDADGNLISFNTAGAVTVPAEADVRDSVAYGVSQTGTLKVPDPAYVSLGIETDDTVGTLKGGPVTL